MKGSNEPSADIRPIAPADITALVRLNETNVAELSPTDENAFQKLVAVASAAIVVGDHDQPAAFLLAFDHTTPRQGPNHGWFLERYPSFLYVDRVCVAASARRRGLARQLYERVFASARERGVAMVVCEVSVPNPVSDAFHESLGFTEVGRAHHANIGKIVRYLTRPIGPSAVAG